MTEPSAQLIDRCRVLAARLNMAVVSFQMQPVSIDTANVALTADSAHRNATIHARYAEMYAEAKLKWRAEFATELDVVCNALAQAGNTLLRPPMDWDVPSMKQTARILAAI
jgi:hypothetical protein